MAYGKLKADSIIYDDSGSDVEKTIASLASAASTASPTFTGDVTLTGAAANVVFDASDNALEFADSAKASFGTGSDLKLYADGNNSLIDHNGDGSLYIRTVGTSEGINIQATGNALVKTGASSKTAINCVGDGTVELYHNNSKKFETTAAGATVTGTVSDSNGDVRKIPYATKSSAYTLVEADGGKVIYTSSGGVTVPASVLIDGYAVTIINNSGSDQTITQGSGMTIYNTADASTGNRTLAGRGMATLYFVSSSACYISGSGLS